MHDSDNSPRLHVLIVTGIFPPDIGGPATYVPAMATALVTRGNRVTVVTLSETVEDEGKLHPFRVVRLRRGLFKPYRVLRTIAALIRNGWGADVIFANGLFPEAILANIFLRKPLAQKWVSDWAWERATNQGWVSSSFEDFQRRRLGFKVEFFKLLRSFCARAADAVIVPSRYLGRAVADWGVTQEKIVTIYNTVETDSVSPVTIPFSTELKLVTVGRLIAMKRIDHIIRAIRDLQNLGLVIVGDGPEQERLKALVREQGLVDRIYFAGQKTKQETLSLMAACDIFVLHSTHEGLPHTVLEAMSLGMPVVATAVGGTPELVCDGENGRLISSHSENGLSETLRHLLSSPSERARLAQGGKRTLERFRPSTMIEKTEAVLRCLCQQPTPASRGNSGLPEHVNL
jgi:glycosyltransferase involved in cell wall biosynthesis